MRSKYLFWFAHEHLDFRWPEISSIISLFGIQINWLSNSYHNPFWIGELAHENEAHLICSRSVTLRSIILLWAHGQTLQQVHDTLQTFPKHNFSNYLCKEKSFCVRVHTFNKTFSMQEKVDKIELFNYLPAYGPVNLQSPDTVLHYIEYYGTDPNNVPDEPFYHFIGPWICNGQRDLITKLSLKTRKFIGNTSMDPQLSLIMANQAQVKKGDLVIDPFVGTGSLLVAAASFGAYVIGTDIDFLMLHGRTRPTRIQVKGKTRAVDESVRSNLIQYGLGSQYIDVIVADSSLPIWIENLEFDSIITDPPYGIREATERIGTTKEWHKISEEHLPGHIPSKVDYTLAQIFSDLIQFAVKHLKLGGRLVSWVPVSIREYREEQLPSHPSLKLISNSEQVLNSNTSRRLLTWEKISKHNSETNISSNDLLKSQFRNHYFGTNITKENSKLM